MPSPDICLEARQLRLGHRARRGGGFTLACDNLDISIAEHEFVVIVGPSGCGKTTFLEAVAGLVPVADGALELHGRPIDGPGPERSLVFQHASLFPWRTVLANVQFGPQVQGRLDATARERAKELLDMAGLAHVADKYPHELSGGMRQRVNLARALATDPALLLLDEPFGALDAQTRENLQEELLRIWQADGVGNGKTALFVTHDVNEAVLLADRVLVFSPSPARIALEITIDAPRPREAAWRRSAEFLAYGDQILDALHPSRDTARNDDDDVSTADGEPATAADPLDAARLGAPAQ
ncbi:ABC transporter ATP-binding protein [Amycolatopsis acidiphila]|uniref:ABC transporter ATP-binding protein n=1 Tax=Amycolatopsis acidiphila TaxID=715473 RepID=A0A558A631_9PSEU|nr:ABC transporter ATP-binding protein [Amycolatopsis acidiphila]TVT19729.1 ABC transporter ATP-binding protein [Amycolatopsis acidiphila]UIJ61913.1 ABC transporter ATP-binding protein [Amycolatopsis acidiphila]GHG57192.1 ABC transporter ATP-binding protein [Amycolatopsis acidiphila]